MAKKIISAREVVKKFNIPYHTLNYYSAMGLLPILGKNGNQRLFDEHQIKRRIERITRLTKEGYPLHLVRKKIVGV